MRSLLHEFRAQSGVDYRAIAHRTRLPGVKGVSEETVYKLAQGERKTVSFSVADSLLCAMDLVHLWWQEPFKNFYLSVDLKGEGTDLCKGCGCAYVPRQSSQLYCSLRCRKRANNIAMRPRKREYARRKYAEKRAQRAA